MDGNKRIGAFMFIWFLQLNKHHLKNDGQVKINDNALVAIALLVAQSDPMQKEIMIKLIVNLIKDLPSSQISPLRRQLHKDAKNFNLTTAELNQRFAEIADFKWSTYQFLNYYDLIICPPCATIAKPHGQCLNEIKDFTYTMSFNNSGSPAVVVPFATSENGLPIGVQIVANLWQDHVALAVAKVLELYNQAQHKLTTLEVMNYIN